MRITVISDPILSVPPRGYGGAERVIADLCAALRDQGHAVTLLAAEGSRNYGRLIKHRAPGKRFVSRAFRKILFQPTSLVAAIGADVVHNFGRVDYLWGLLKTRIPLVHTFENPISSFEIEFFRRAWRARLSLVSVSNHQRSAFDQELRWDTVYNAVDLERTPFSPTPSASPYLAFLGRLTENKGVHLAIEVARAAGLPLKIAGNISTEPGGRDYFESRVKPQLGGSIEWVGELNDQQKGPFLGGALALLFPIQWNEPFAVVVGETLACGTPVIALRRASTPEAIQDGTTGFLCDSVEDMVAAVSRVPSIRREACREFAANVLSSRVMAKRYLTIYESAARA